VVELAAQTGLRRGDLLKLAWTHVGEDAIVMKTGKSGQRREAVVPLHGGLRACWRRSRGGRRSS